MRVLNRSGQIKETQFPKGAIVAFTGLSIPTGWVLCDGTGSTPDLRDRFIVGASAVGTGVPAGTISPVTGATHSGLAVGNHSNHSVGQSSNHANHTITQAGAHAAHTVTENSTHTTHNSVGGHTHDAHPTATQTTGIGTERGTPVTHSSAGGHTHDAHPAHTGTAVDSGAAHSSHSGADLDPHSAHTGWGVDAHSAHSVTQPSAHSTLKHYLLVYIIKT